MRTRRERGDTGRAIVAWLGAGCVSGASALVAGTIPPVALVGNERGREWGSLRPGAYWPGRGLGCASPLLVVVAFLVVTISLGSVKGVGVGGWVWVLTIRLVAWGVWLRGSGCGLGCGLVVWVG